MQDTVESTMRLYKEENTIKDIFFYLHLSQREGGAARVLKYKIVVLSIYYADGETSIV